MLSALNAIANAQEQDNHNSNNKKKKASRKGRQQQEKKNKKISNNNPRLLPSSQDALPLLLNNIAHHQQEQQQQHQQPVFDGQFAGVKVITNRNRWVEVQVAAKSSRQRLLSHLPWQVWFREDGVLITAYFHVTSWTGGRAEPTHFFVQGNLVPLRPLSSLRGAQILANGAAGPQLKETPHQMLQADLTKLPDLLPRPNNNKKKQQHDEDDGKKKKNTDNNKKRKAGVVLLDKKEKNSGSEEDSKKKQGDQDDDAVAVANKKLRRSARPASAVATKALLSSSWPSSAKERLLWLQQPKRFQLSFSVDLAKVNNQEIKDGTEIVVTVAEEAKDKTWTERFVWSRAALDQEYRADSLVKGAVRLLSQLATEAPDLFWTRALLIVSGVEMSDETAEEDE